MAKCRFTIRWPAIIAASIVLLLLTLDPLIASLLPYISAGWPAARTAFWLKRNDPWRARGTVGLLFHLCMALFCAGVCALVWVIATVVAADYFNKAPNLVEFSVAISTIAFGCLISSVLAWTGAVIAFRHKVRIYVMPGLYSVCHGDFHVAKTLETSPLGANPANYIVGVATATPLFAAWFVAMLVTFTVQPDNHKQLPIAFSLLILLPVFAISSVGIVMFISSRIMAQSPKECWGAEIPTAEEPENWYRSPN